MLEKARKLQKKVVFPALKSRLLHIERPSLRIQKTVFEIAKGHLLLFAKPAMPLSSAFSSQTKSILKKPFVNFSSCKRRFVLNKEKNPFCNGNNKSTGNKVNSRNHKQLKCQASTHQTLYAPAGKRR